MLFFTMRGSYTHPDLPPPIIFIVTSHSPTPVMSSPNSLIPHRGTPASARSATSSNRGVSFTLPSPDALASPPSNNRIAADSIDPSADDHFVRAIARHSVASPQAVLLTPSNERSATSSNPGVSFTLPSPDASLQSKCLSHFGHIAHTTTI